ncbi:unnamed protein product, partial [Pelagomonas calceolata]
THPSLGRHSHPAVRPLGSLPRGDGLGLFGSLLEAPRLLRRLARGALFRAGGLRRVAHGPELEVLAASRGRAGDAFFYRGVDHFRGTVVVLPSHRLLRGGAGALAFGEGLLLRVLFFFGFGAEALGHVGSMALLGAVLVAVVAAAGVNRNAYRCCARP